jgi:A/G-specific adenine glycosylase
MQKNSLKIAKTAKPDLSPALPELLLSWYDQNARPLPWRTDRVPYHVWLSEIMLQQTRAEVVKAYYTRFLKEFPTIEALACADEEKLLKLWEGLGYYSRARNLKKAAGIILREYGGVFPDQYGQIIRLPGIGPYTAGAIASICFGQKTPAVDGNVHRIISRIAGLYGQDDPASVKKDIAAALLPHYPEDRTGDFTQSLMELGATICLPSGRPKCAQCPVSGLCKAYKDDRVTDCPKRQPKKEKRQQELTVFVLTCNQRTALRRREKEGLLGGMWELPNTPGKLNERQAFSLASTWGTAPLAIIKSTEQHHLFTHIRWDMVCYYIECSVMPSPFTWLSPEDLTRSCALPSAFRMFIA